MIRFLVPALALCASGAAMAAPAIIDGTPEPSTWLTLGCAALLLTTMQRRR